MEQFHGTTIISVRRGNQVAVGGDGQVTLGNIIIKGTARKIRRLYHDKILAGFAGATADAFTLQERFEGKLEKHQGHLMSSRAIGAPIVCCADSKQCSSSLTANTRWCSLVMVMYSSLKTESLRLVQVAPTRNLLRSRCYATPICPPR